jgi:hypothetical protein
MAPALSGRGWPRAYSPFLSQPAEAVAAADVIRSSDSMLPASIQSAVLPQAVLLPAVLPQAVLLVAAQLRFWHRPSPQ